MRFIAFYLHRVEYPRGETLPNPSITLDRVLALVEVRKENIALSYANAFVKPVRATGKLSLIEASAKALEEYIPAINERYNLSAQRAFLSTVPFTLSGAECCSDLEKLITWLSKQIGGGVQ